MKNTKEAAIMVQFEMKVENVVILLHITMQMLLQIRQLVLMAPTDTDW